MKKNQVSLRSGGIRGASFVVLYAALACAACLLAVPRSKSLFSSVQFRQQNVAKKTVNSVCCVWVHVSLSSREFFQTQITACLRRARNENPSRAPDDLNDPDAFSLRLQWCHVPCARGTHFEATTCFTSSKRTLLGSYLSLQEDFISMFSQLFPVWISFWISLDPYGPTTALRSKRLGLTFGACWHLQWCCSTWERRPRAACTCSRGVRKV
jgi:hypothetical protein